MIYKKLKLKIHWSFLGIETNFYDNRAVPTKVLGKLS